MDSRDTHRPARTRRWFRIKVVALVGLVGLVVLLAGPALWLRVSSAGHRHTVADAPSAGVVIVFGAQLAPGGTRPKPFLASRLRTTAALVRAGRARAVLVSGDGASAAGSETDVMRTYLTELGVDQAKIVNDPSGLDTYDTCRRARDVYGVRRALLVTQSYHLPRAVALCRTLGIDADGVDAGCVGCLRTTLARNWLRELAAGPKAALDALRDRPPAVASPPDPALTTAAAR
jgi:vancomycin permeability regulator SanA